MAKSTAGRNRKKSITGKPGFRLGVILSALMMILALAVLFLWYTYRSLFNNNDHFILKRVVVRSGGWWNGRSEEVESILGLKEGESNAFAIDLKKVKEKLEKQPSIQKVSVERILPDTLKITIMERSPVAFLYRRGGKKVVDENGTVMLTKTCISVDRGMPVLTGFKSQKNDLSPGNQLPQVIPALHFIDEVHKTLPEMMILRISMNNPDYYNNDVYLPRYRKRYTLYIAKKGINAKLFALKILLKDIIRTKPKATVIDMRYQGQTVVK